MNVSYMDRVLEPIKACLTPEVARRLLDLRANPDVQARLDELADKANEGHLTIEEQAEYDQYRTAFHLVTILQAKAHDFLQHPTA